MFKFVIDRLLVILFSSNNLDITFKRDLDVDKNYNVDFEEKTCIV